MSERDPLHQIEARCEEVQRSPYLYRDLPAELQRLQSMVKNVDMLVKHDVPFLIAEVKRLRTENKKLLAEMAAEFDGSDPDRTSADGASHAVRIDAVGANGHAAAS